MLKAEKHGPTISYHDTRDELAEMSSRLLLSQGNQIVLRFHPKWKTKVMKFGSERFSNTDFFF